MSTHDQELYIEKACKVNLDLSAGICDNLANHTDIKIEVQKEVAGIQVAPIALYFNTKHSLLIVFDTKHGNIRGSSNCSWLMLTYNTLFSLFLTPDFSPIGSYFFLKENVT